jgi:hypothetical protein
MKLHRILLVFTIAVSFFACRHLHDAVSEKADPKVDYAKEGYVKAIVTDVQLDGCKYMLQLESDNKRLEPEELTPAFQHDSLKVWIKYEVDDRMSVCMAGQTIKLLDIRKR